MKKGLLLPALLISLLLFSCEKRTPQSFDSQKWSSADERQRMPMARELVRADALIHLSRTDVLEQLGEPDAEKSNGLIYELEGALTSRELKIEFGNANRVISAKIES